MQKLENLHIKSILPVLAPQELKRKLPLTKKAVQTVLLARQIVTNIIKGKDKRLLIIAGPCSIHDTKEAIEYATRLKQLLLIVQDKVFIIMRTYFEKPRTTIGWKGFINDPSLNGLCDINSGFLKARELLLKINEIGIGTATEFLDPVTPQYIADLISWAAIGARTTESQTHREMASGLSMPVGFKNGTDGDLHCAVNAMISIGHKQSFLGVDQKGQVSVVQTRGNKSGHIILRGGKGKPNYKEKFLKKASLILKEHNLPGAIMIDCSHDNSMKDHKKQAEVFKYTLRKKLEGEYNITGIMLESNLHAGNQLIPKDKKKLIYGVSITDKCIGWEKTKELILFAHKRLRSRLNHFLIN